MAHRYAGLAVEERYLLARMSGWLQPIRLNENVVAHFSWPWPTRYVTVECLRKEVERRNQALRNLARYLADIAVRDFLEEEQQR